MKGIRIRGFRIGRKLCRVFKRIVRRKKNSTRFICSNQPSRAHNPISKVVALARKLRRGARRVLCFPDTGYARLGQTVKPVEVPKGHLAVYVEDDAGDARRVVVPVIYFNHPLFGELLKEAERVYGYDQLGGLVLPCGLTKFEKVRMRIDSWGNCHRNKANLCNFWRQPKMIT